MSPVAVALVVAVAACSSTPPAPAPPPPPADAAIDGITEIGSYDPTSGMHLDDDAVGSAVARPPMQRRAGRPIEVTLRSQPPQADVFVDGVPLGTTPAFWMGEANGKEHTFTFRLRGHATAVYRFVPVQSGVVHGRLVPVGPDAEPAGVLPPPPPPPEAKRTPPAPPPTVVSPKPDAAVPPPTGSDGSGSDSPGSGSGSGSN